MEAYEIEHKHLKGRTERITDEYVEKLENELREKENKVRNLLFLNEELNKRLCHEYTEEDFFRDIEIERENKRYYLHKIEKISENLERISKVKKLNEELLEKLKIRLITLKKQSSSLTQPRSLSIDRLRSTKKLRYHLKVNQISRNQSVSRLMIKQNQLNKELSNKKKQELFLISRYNEISAVLPNLSPPSSKKKFTT